jgi:hypothetical protein
MIGRDVTKTGMQKALQAAALWVFIQTVVIGYMVYLVDWLTRRM